MKSALLPVLAIALISNQGYASELIPIASGNLHREMNKFATEKGMDDIRTSLSRCEDAGTKTYCRYRIGEFGIVTVIGDSEYTKSNEIAFTASTDTMARSEMTNNVLYMLIEMTNPGMSREGLLSGAKGLFDKFGYARNHPRMPQQVEHKIGPFKYVLYQDLSGQINFNIMTD